MAASAWTLGSRLQAQGPAGQAIDVHAHYFPRPYLESLARDGGIPGFAVDLTTAPGPTLTGGGAVTVLDDTYWDLPKRIAAMDRARVQVHALSLTMPMPHLAAPARGAELARLYNDAVIDTCTRHPDRFVGCVALPLQDVSLASTELARVGRTPQMRAAYFPTHINGTELSSRTLDPLYDALQTLDLPLMLHPHPPVVGLDRMQRFYLPNLLGNPFDTTVAAVHLVAGGVLDRFPRLRVVLPHAGGTFPFVAGRVQRGQQVIPDLQHVAEHPVSEYVRRFYYDTLTHSPEALAFVVSVAGIDRVVMGSDYCFNMGYEQPREIVERLSVSAADRQQILSGNARALLRMA
jgi:aminocarboxymuconate-semialdehyde decarboxylase